MSNINKIVLATAKGAVGQLPIVGGLISEYIGLAAENIASKRQEEWINMIEEKLVKLECEMSKIADNEFLYSCIQIATVGALKAHQKGKREIFANAIYNAFVLTDIAEEKREIFISLIDRYTLSTIRVLKCYSEDGYSKYNNKKIQERNNQSNNMFETYSSPSQEMPIEYINAEIPELRNEPSLVQTITTQLYADGLIQRVDFAMPRYPDETRRKRTTTLGDEFIRFIATNDEENSNDG